MATDLPNNTTGTKPATPAGPKSKDSKTTDPKKIRIIMEFLQGCSPYESDALRAMLAVVEKPRAIDPLRQSSIDP